MSVTTSVAERSTQQEWFASWFDSAHYHTLYAHRNALEAAGFIEALMRRGHLSAGSSVLDLGCGTGRHAKYLASKGFDVTGLDLSAESLRRARADQGSKLRFIRRDMREPFGVNAFDHVLSLFTSFGYFDDPADHVTVIHNAAMALNPGGLVVLDYLNSRYVDAHLSPEDIIEQTGVTYRVSRWTDADHIFKRIAIEETGSDAPVEHIEQVAKLTLEDFRFMFAVCDMRIVAVYGNYQLASFDPESSPRLILVAAKRPASVAAGLPSREVLANAAYGLRRHAEIRGEHGLRDACGDR
jgi:SAM-dependent methyltransferase